MTFGMIAPLLTVGSLAFPPMDPFFLINLASGDPPGSITMIMLIAPDGHVRDCEVIRSDYGAAKSERICRKTIGEQTGVKPFGLEGEPVHGVLTKTRVVLREGGRPDPEGNRKPADLEVFVAQLPGNEGSRRIELVVYVDESGMVRRCLQRPGQDTDFAEVACAQSTGVKFPVRSDAGKAFGYVTEITVDFLTDGESA